MRRTIPAETTLLEALETLYPDSTRNTLRRMLDTGRVRVDNVVQRRAKTVVQAGQVVAVAERVAKPAPEDRPRVEVLFEDEHLLVVEKPPGLLTVATDRGDSDTLFARVASYLRITGRGGRAFIVHRLDRGTSGVIVFAKDAETADALQAGFAERGVERVYHVLVEGTPDPPEGTVAARLAESDSLQVYVTPSARHGKEAITHYRTLSTGRRLSLLEIRLGTGRRHQIRVHMASIGHPVVGDAEHGATTDPLRRLALHAHALRFAHPATGDAVDVNSKTPQRFLAALGGRGPAPAAADDALPAPGAGSPRRTRRS